ncbi:MAG: Trk system potassium transporter TrkA [Alphaproteobacteria bacterium]|nr:Trk system potassium transporter TrkA [Alphaproteobacteria bacterium]
MRAIVCGAGQVGSSIARELAAEEVNVTVIDQRPDLIKRISDTLEVQALVGFASHPDVLEAAGARDAEMIIAVTFADEVNMVACQVAHSLFNVPTKIARVRARSYLKPDWADLFTRSHLPIDVIISPEIEVARAIRRRLAVPGAFEVIPLAGDRLRLVGVRCREDCPLVRTPLRQLTTLFPELRIRIVGIRRDERPIVPRGDDQMLPGDDVYFVVDTRQVGRAMAAFGHLEPEAHRVLIIGAGNIGQGLAEDLAASDSGVEVKLIEIDKERAEKVAQACPRAIVLNGDALDPELLAEAGVGRVETVVAVSNDDEVNILASLLAKRSGAQRAVTLVNKLGYGPLTRPLGIDVVVNPRAITVSTILQHIRRGRIHSVHLLSDDFGEILEAEALETSGLVGVPLREARLPPGVIIGALVRGGEVQVARPDTVLAAGDRVVLFAVKESVKAVEKLFSVRLEFF